MVHDDLINFLNRHSPSSDSTSPKNITTQQVIDDGLLQSVRNDLSNQAITARSLIRELIRLRSILNAKWQLWQWTQTLKNKIHTYLATKQFRLGDKFEATDPGFIELKNLMKTEKLKDEKGNEIKDEAKLDSGLRARLRQNLFEGQFYREYDDAWKNPQVILKLFEYLKQSAEEHEVFNTKKSKTHKQLAEELSPFFNNIPPSEMQVSRYLNLETLRGLAKISNLHIENAESINHPSN